MSSLRIDKNPAGKMKFTSVLIVAIIFYGGFVAVKIITANVMNGQIKTDIIDKLGFVRGPDFTIETGEEIIKEILKKHGVLDKEYEDENYEDYGSYDDEEKEHLTASDYRGHGISVTIDEKRSFIVFFLKYKYVNDFVFFKQEKIYDVRGEVQNYN